MSASSRMMSLKPALCTRQERVRSRSWQQSREIDTPSASLHLRTRKRLDLLAHDVNAAIVGGVQLSKSGSATRFSPKRAPLAHLEAVVPQRRARPIDLACHGENRRGLAGAGRAIEEQVRNAVLRDELVD